MHGRVMMTAQRRGCWRCLMLLVLSSLISTSGTAVTPLDDDTYNESSLQEVLEIPNQGTTRVCVVPLNMNTRLRVQHTDTDGGRQEVVVRKKALTQDTLSLLEIEVQTDDESMPTLIAWLNGTELPRLEYNSPPSSAPQQPRTVLLLKGYARITLCPAAPEARDGKMLLDGEEQTVTQGQGETVTQGQGETVTQEQGRETVTTSSTASTEPPSTTDDASFNSTSEETESDEDDPWWSFVLVLGKVGEVPVLALLVGGVLLGSLVGGVVVCVCLKACEKRRVAYDPLPLRAPTVPRNDFIREPKLVDRVEERSSGIGSAFSTLTKDEGSTNSIPATNVTMHNLGRGAAGSPGGSTSRGRVGANNTLTTKYSGSMTGYGSHMNTGSYGNREAEGSWKLPQGNNVARTNSNKSNASSVNRNTNRSPKIPFTKTLGTLAGHQDTLMLHNRNSEYDDDWDSDDPNYDKPYVSPPIQGPIVPETYSVPHSTQVVKLERPTNTLPSDSVADRHLTPSKYATFTK